MKNSTLPPDMHKGSFVTTRFSRETFTSSPPFLVISPHSFSGLISNSSSETFMVSGQKSLNAFKKALESIARELEKKGRGEEGWNEPDVYEYKLFTEYFKEPYIMRWSFDPSNKALDLENDAYATYLKYSRFLNIWDLNNGGEVPAFYRPLFLAHEKGLKEMEEWREENGDDRNSPCRNWDKYLKAYGVIYQEYNTILNEVKYAFYEKVFQSTNELKPFSYYFEYRDFDPAKDIENYSGKGKKWRLKSTYSERSSKKNAEMGRDLERFCDAVQLCLSGETWVPKVSKGDIFLEMAGCNSVPDELVGVLRDTFGALNSGH